MDIKDVKQLLNFIDNTPRMTAKRALGLIALYQGGKMRASQFARAVNMTAASAVQVTSDFRKEGLIVDLLSEEDRRTRLIELSETGKSIVERGILNLQTVES